MGTLWRVMLFLMAGLVTVQMAAVPTQDTLVITRSDASTPEAEATTEITSEEPNAPIKLTEMQVNSEITMRYAHTAVVNYVKNPSKKAQEATFRVLLPETAFISGFTMTLGGKSYKAYVKEKNEAKNIYQDAVSHGYGAAYVGAKARDSNHFTVSVNVEPKTVAIFNLTYEELLVRRNGVYNHAINLHPGALVPKLSVRVYIRETEKIKELRVPEVRTGNEIDATSEDTQNSKAIIEKTHDDREAIITFNPDLEEQKRLIDVYEEKAKESQNFHGGYRYFDNNENKQDKGVLGQFVVQYDVDRPANGEVLLNDGYFVHIYAPQNLPPLNKHVVFVLDTSGSMSGHKIDQLHEAMSAILAELNRGDYFSIVEFSNGVIVHDLKEADSDKLHGIGSAYAMENSNVELVPPYKATELNIAKAKIIVQRLVAAGGTNIDKALDVAVKLIKKGINWTPKGNSTENISEVTTTKSPSDEIKLEPIIIFLTDGEPTVGETDPTRIINRVSEKNFGDSKATIFSLAFGEDADRSFLRKLSLRNDGFMRHIYEAADAALQLRHFYQQVASPLLSNAKFTYPEDQVKDVTKTKFREIYAGSEVIIAGQYKDVDDTNFKPELNAFCGNADAPGGGKKKFGTTPKVTRKSTHLPLERLWSYLTIKQLLDKRDAADNPNADAEKTSEKKALDLALKYSFVTPLTSLVVVKPNATKAVDAESVDKENLPPMYAMQGPPGASYAWSSNSQSARPALLSAPMASVPLSLDYQPFLALEEEEVDDAAAFGAGSTIGQWHSTTPFIATTDTPVAKPQNDLAQWKLEAYQWTAPMLNASLGLLQVHTDNGTVTLKLTSQDDVPKEAADEECARTHEGVAGSCVYLTRCQVDDDFNSQMYKDTYCSVKGYAGICCSKTKIDLKKPQKHS